MKYDKSKIVFCDTETTGLYAYVGDTGTPGHEVWEMAFIYWDNGWVEYTGTVRPNLATADPFSMSLNKFYERDHDFSPPDIVAKSVARILAGKHIVGAIPSFDAVFLDKFLRKHGQIGTWHYHLIDVEALALGWIARGDKEAEITGQRLGDDFFDATELPLPWKSDWMLPFLSLEKDPNKEHTALGDAQLVKQVWERIMGDG